VKYLIALNRLLFERVATPQREAFSDWFLIEAKGVPLHTFEIPHLHGPAMEALTRLGKLPSKAIKGSELPVLVRSRVKRWRDQIHSQLDSTGLFLAENTESLVHA
jgi:hypothetical protein